jgi:hypothetical protein
MLLLHKSLFIQVVLNNAQSWSNMTKSNIHTLQTVQLKFLKRIFHAPSSTSNPLTFLETGALPIEYEIHVKQLMKLHHIVTLEDDEDPVKKQYEQQLLYPAPNWANEVGNLRKRYNLIRTDTEIAKLSKDTWKNEVTKKVSEKALADLNSEAKEQKKAQNLLPYPLLSRQNYMSDLSPKHARIIFHIRTGTIDLRSIRKYTYGNNTSCRLCLSEDETVEHVTNKCPKMGCTTQITNIYTTDCKELTEMAKRFAEFKKKVDAVEKQQGD